MYSSYRVTGTQLNEEASLGILKHLNKDELQKLCDDDLKLAELINDDQQMKSFEVDKESLLTSNKSVAEYNLNQEPRLQSAKQQLATTYEQAIQVQKEYDEKKEKIDFKTSQNSLDTVLALLQTESAKAEERTEGMANSFLEGNMEVDAFIDEYISQRTVAHQRKIRVEKMQELMTSGVPTPAKPTTGAAPSATPQAYQNWNTPFQGSHMAMPNASSYLPR